MIIVIPLVLLGVMLLVLAPVMMAMYSSGRKLAKTLLGKPAWDEADRRSAERAVKYLKSAHDTESKELVRKLIDRLHPSSAP